MRKKAVSGILISIGISLLLLLTSFLSITLFENNFLEATAENNTVIANSMKNKIEYSIRYGKSLSNYFGIDEIFQELESYCSYYDYAFVSDADGTILYESNPNEAWNEKRVAGLEDYAGVIESLRDGEDGDTFIDNKEQMILVSIRDREGALSGTLGFLYDTNSCESDIRPFIRQIYMWSIVCILGGIILFLLVYLLRNKELQYKSLLRSSLLCFLVSAVALGVLCFPVFKNGYQKIANETAGFYVTYVSDEIQSVVDKGVHYDELYEMSGYFDELCQQSGLVKAMKLQDKNAGSSSDTQYTVALKADETGTARTITAYINEKFIPSQLRTIMISIFMTVVSAAMIAGEALIFLISVLTSDRKKQKHNTVGHVRGLSFFFSTFEYMATAFVSIVLISIYQPIVIFGYTIPKPIVMALPLSIQILTSMVTSYLAGVLIQKNGWKKIAVAGNVIMIVGTFLAGAAHLTMTFIGAQVVIGIGLGFEKTALDLYAVFTADAQGESIEQYTSQANAGIMMGFSASSAIGGILADRFGYTGSYFVMGFIGIAVLLLILFFGKEEKAVAAETVAQVADTVKKADPRDLLKFFSYLVMVVVPYFFVMMFVDYFFPVYANQDGISTAVIGYVFLFYGMISSYGGTWMCNIIVQKKWNEIKLMTLNMLLVGVAIAIFAFTQNVILLLLVIAVIALSDGIMPSLQYKYVSELAYTRQKGMEMTVGIEGVFSSGIRGLAPMIFGVLMAIGNSSMILLGGVVCVLSILFYMNNHGRRKL